MMILSSSSSLRCRRHYRKICRRGGSNLVAARGGRGCYHGFLLLLMMITLVVFGTMGTTKIGSSYFSGFIILAEAADTLGEVYDEVVDVVPNAQQQQQEEEENPSASSRNDHSTNSNDVNLRWASSGGGWRAMIASMGFANVFQQAGLFTMNSTSKFNAISTNSGSSWFSTQFFYSTNFYRQTIMSTPDQLYNFTTQWMNTYQQLSDSIVQESDGSSSLSFCNNITNDLSNTNDTTATPTEEIRILQELCHIIVYYDGDWAFFITQMLEAASTNAYNDPTFVNRQANSINRIQPLQNTDMYIMTALSPASRIRQTRTTSSTSSSSLKKNEKETTDRHDVPFDRNRRTRRRLGQQRQRQLQVDDTIVYLGPTVEEEEEEQQQLLYTTVQGVTYVVSSDDAKDHEGGDHDNGDDDDYYYYMSDSHTSNDFNLYNGRTPTTFDFEEFENDSFFLYDTQTDGTTTIVNPHPLGGGGGSSDLMLGLSNVVYPMPAAAKFHPPFGGGPASVTQLASISSAIVGSMSPLSPITFAQAMDKAWKAGVKQSELLVGPITMGPAKLVFDAAVNRFYQSSMFDSIAVCSQWRRMMPQPPTQASTQQQQQQQSQSSSCGQFDGYFMDGGVVENNALSATISQYQKQQEQEELQSTDTNTNTTTTTTTLKVILTNTNREWISDYDLTQILQYFDSPSINKGVQPGEFLSLRERTIPFRSPQIFQDYMDLDLLESLLVPMDGSNITTITLSNLTTTENPIYGISAGLSVDLLLINLNEDITTIVAGPSIIANLTAPHAEMARKIASNEILVERVRQFVHNGGGDDDDDNGDDIDTSVEINK